MRETAFLHPGHEVVLPNRRATVEVASVGSVCRSNRLEDLCTGCGGDFEVRILDGGKEAIEFR